ncbi:hypothetical protein PR048_000358 [Dryococelus australis]|uniref:Uncharacterized protein n=1 Tax=Dryococelus australis TaxID=614101 RepID=A0ABQ9IEF6_9NEOP|nr:hypothetical protein PR048_000358 [Dryococelus australis]
MRVIEVSMGQRRDEREWGNGRSPRKPADQWHRFELLPKRRVADVTGAACWCLEGDMWLTRSPHNLQTQAASHSWQSVMPSQIRNRIRLERASQKQSSDTHKTPYDLLKRCRESKINIKAPERVNVDHEKTRRLAASSGTIPTCENPGETPPGSEPGSPRVEASSLTTTLPRPLTHRHGIPDSSILLVVRSIICNNYGKISSRTMYGIYVIQYPIVSVNVSRHKRTDVVQESSICFCAA